jgi:hypothetical protein
MSYRDDNEQLAHKASVSIVLVAPAADRIFRSPASGRIFTQPQPKFVVCEPIRRSRNRTLSTTSCRQSALHDLPEVAREWLSGPSRRSCHHRMRGRQGIAGMRLGGPLSTDRNHDHLALGATNVGAQTAPLKPTPCYCGTDCICSADVEHSRAAPGAGRQWLGGRRRQFIYSACSPVHGLSLRRPRSQHGRMFAPPAEASQRVGRCRLPFSAPGRPLRPSQCCSDTSGATGRRQRPSRGFLRGMGAIGAKSLLALGWSVCR